MGLACECLDLRPRPDAPADRGPCRFSADTDRSQRYPTSPGTAAFNTTWRSRRVFNGTVYLDRAAPRLAPAKFLVLAFTRGPFIELDPGSNCPRWIFWPGWSALASRFLAFCPAFAFARRRALALVMSSSPYPLRQPVPANEIACSGAKQDRRIGSPRRFTAIEPCRTGRPPPTGVGGGAWHGYSMIDRFSAEDLPFCPG